MAALQCPLACNLDPAKGEGDRIGSLSANIGQSLTLCTLKEKEEEEEVVLDKKKEVRERRKKGGQEESGTC
ncbi:hypothetical protein E2C01_099100 [Portunus trituberculatus]|uniref:Uncharacterized protein n=1 Tax=Portunus trituberculatus TaxID=210409 RepID=A0A5B7K8P7_PORTR|nr:hypothetical protein [Portunus trituberculatus]